MSAQRNQGCLRTLPWFLLTGLLSDLVSLPNAAGFPCARPLPEPAAFPCARPVPELTAFPHFLSAPLRPEKSEDSQKPQQQEGVHISLQQAAHRHRQEDGQEPPRLFQQASHKSPGRAPRTRPAGAAPPAHRAGSGGTARRWPAVCPSARSAGPGRSGRPRRTCRTRTPRPYRPPAPDR